MREFLLTTVVISLSGVLAPGPITAATLAAGMRSRHAGILVAAGHIAIELPLIVLLAAGLRAFVEINAIRAGIGLAGGGFLLVMGVQLLLSLPALDQSAVAPAQRHPFWNGVILTATNPYFWVWGATVGLALTSQALKLGPIALVLFAVVHWACDLGWLEFLSLAGFKSADVFGKRSQAVIFALCALMMVGFGLKFLWDSVIALR